MAHRSESPVSPRVRRLLLVASAVLGLATVAGMVLLWPGERPEGRAAELGLISQVHDAKVIELRIADLCPGTEPDQNILCPIAIVEVLDGPDTGERVEVPLPAAFDDLRRGETVVVGVLPGAPPDQKYTLQDRDRQPILLWLAIAFGVTVLILGGLRGGAAMGGLGASLAVLLVFVLPAIMDGKSPVVVAVVGASAIAFMALFLAHGFTAMTAVALMGTLGALGITAGLATLFVELAQITGLATEEASLVDFAAAQIDLRGLILAGVILGGLGAIDDMTVTQASAVWELRAASPGMSDKLLFRAGMRIGRDHVASTVNTLALAYAGASMPVLVLFILSGQSLGAVANSEVVGTEIVRTLVGSIGLVCAVPLTTWLAARCVPRASAVERPEAVEGPEAEAERAVVEASGEPASVSPPPRRDGADEDAAWEPHPEDEDPEATFWRGI